ncbi:MAG TPA: S8 family serine peptidase [Candidatus Thermoplasmatota archaeon]|nr:S8 family serine peptidase [Candidatus Thermoplasmatota archaeon]
MRHALLGLLVIAALALPGCLTGLPFVGTSNVEPSTWAFDYTGLNALAAQGYTGKGVNVAIVDTGIDLGHPDLNGVRFGKWKDYVNGQASPYDDDGHGTLVAGIIVGRGLVRGGAPDVTLSVYKAIRGGTGEGAGSGTDADVAEAINQAVRDGAHVICLSLGSGRALLLGPSTANAAAAAVNRGIYVVAAAGNEGEDPNTKDVAAPADVAGVIAVASLDVNKRVAASSNAGSETGPLGPTGLALVPREHPNKKPEVSAPGVGILSTFPGGKYARADGTSMAAPFVAAGIAQLLEAKPGYMPGKGKDVGDMKAAILQGAEKLPGYNQQHDRKAGYGLFRADLTLQKMG